MNRNNKIALVQDDIVDIFYRSYSTPCGLVLFTSLTENPLGRVLTEKEKKVLSLYTNSVLVGSHLYFHYVLQENHKFLACVPIKKEWWHNNNQDYFNNAMLSFYNSYLQYWLEQHTIFMEKPPFDFTLDSRIIVL